MNQLGNQIERGNRGHFIRVGITMDPKMVAELKKLGIKLQSLGYKDFDLSSLIRGACKNLITQVDNYLDESQKM